jgi:RNA polymerase sigma-70 factor (ECF subfamily)
VDLNSGFRHESRESTWIYRVSFNTALVWQRGEHRRHRRHATIVRKIGDRTNQSSDTGIFGVRHCDSPPDAG